jgi:Arc/MetJ family transcription regulator
MRTSLILDDELVSDAMRATGMTQKTAVIHHALRVLIAETARRELAEMGGTRPDFRAPPRRRPKKATR